MSYSDLIVQNIRLVILTLLKEDASYSHNDSVLKSALAAVGHQISTDRLKTELAWLDEQGLVNTENVQSFVVAKLTARGLDVANGTIAAPGVDRPTPS